MAQPSVRAVASWSDVAAAERQPDRDIAASPTSSMAPGKRRGLVYLGAV